MRKECWLTAENGGVKSGWRLRGSKFSNRGIEVLCVKNLLFVHYTDEYKCKCESISLNPDIVGLSVENP